MISINAVCPICRCPGVLIGDTFRTGVRYLAVGQHEPIGTCAYCGVERCHATLDQIATTPDGVSSVFTFHRVDGSTVLIEQGLPPLALAPTPGHALQERSAFGDN